MVVVIIWPKNGYVIIINFFFLVQSAKMFNYAGWRKTCDALFVIFAAVFLITRLVVFPCRLERLHHYTTGNDVFKIQFKNVMFNHTNSCFFRVVYTTAVDCLDVFPPFPGYYFFNFLLLVLQALHVFWAWLILRMVYKFVFLGKVRFSAHINKYDPISHISSLNVQICF